MANGQRVSDMVSTNSMYTSPMEGLGNLVSGTSSNQLAYDFMLDKLGMTPDAFDALGGTEQEGILSSMRELGFTGDTGMGGDWLGIEGLDMNALAGAGQAVMGGIGIYDKITGMGQQKELFDKKIRGIDQAYDINEDIRQADKASKLAFSGATQSAFNKKDPSKGLGSIG